MIAVNSIFTGNVRDFAAQLEPGGIDCIVTSPPYWGLRDYENPREAWGGDPGCVHTWEDRRYYTEKIAGVSSAGAFSEAGQANLPLRLRGERSGTEDRGDEGPSEGEASASGILRSGEAGTAWGR